jgi:eukaryotic-like serine/threonine-protein kinase
MPEASPSPPARLPATSRYELLTKIASGGMATVYVGRLRGAAGFWRLVAIKRAHAHLVEDESFRRMLIAEARLASRIHHPNVVAVDDVEELASGELRLIMDYVEGASLSMLMSAAGRANQPLPPRLAMRIGLDACAGLHAAHQLSDDHGESLRLVHRDVSPHNILVGVDGTARLADFGIAKVARSSVSTTTGAIKGKLGYMAPEYIEGNVPDARSDVFALGAVIWEAVAHRKLFRGTNEVDTLKRVVTAEVPSLAEVDPALGRALDGVLRKALAKLPAQRFQSAQELGAALEAAALEAGLMGSHREVAAGVESLVGPALAERRREIRARSAPEEAPSAPTRTLHQDPSAPAAAPAPPPAASASASAPPSSAITEARPPPVAAGSPPSMSSAATLQREERDIGKRGDDLAVDDEPTAARYTPEGTVRMDDAARMGDRLAYVPGVREPGQPTPLPPSPPASAPRSAPPASDSRTPLQGTPASGPRAPRSAPPPYSDSHSLAGSGVTSKRVLAEEPVTSVAGVPRRGNGVWWVAAAAGACVVVVVAARWARAPSSEEARGEGLVVPATISPAAAPPGTSSVAPTAPTASAAKPGASAAPPPASARVAPAAPALPRATAPLPTARPAVTPTPPPRETAPPNPYAPQ